MANTRHCLVAYVPPPLADLIMRLAFSSHWNSDTTEAITAAAQYECHEITMHHADDESAWWFRLIGECRGGHRPVPYAALTLEQCVTAFWNACEYGNMCAVRALEPRVRWTRSNPILIVDALNIGATLACTSNSRDVALYLIDTMQITYTARQAAAASVGGHLSLAREILALTPGPHCRDRIMKSALKLCQLRARLAAPNKVWVAYSTPDNGMRYEFTNSDAWNTDPAVCAEIVEWLRSLGIEEDE